MATAASTLREPEKVSTFTFRRLPDERTIGSKFGILNHFGQFWTDRIFDNPKDANEYLRDYWGNGADITRWKVVPITVTIAVEPISTEHTVQVYKP